MSDEEEFEVAENESEESSASEIVADEIHFDEDFGDIYTSHAEASLPTRCELISGIAGSGKSHLVRQRIEDDPDYAILSASTGVAAINLNATTIHSLLGFFDYDSLRDAYLRRSAQRKLRELVEDGYHNVVVDEASMISHQTLDTLVNIFDDVNEDLKQSQSPIGLILVADLAQLPPIPDRVPGSRKHLPVPWCFDAACWFRFEANTSVLKQNWRQSDPVFLQALGHARAGKGGACVELLSRGGLEFQTYVDLDFEGTTILTENKHVDAFNQEAMKRVRGRDMFLPSRRWGKERGEWKNIPVQMQLREGAYVMILANSPTSRGTFEYANGDCGWVRGITKREGSPLPYINVELVRTGKEVRIPAIIRSIEYREKPDGFVGDKISEPYYPRPHLQVDRKRYVVGQLQYYPLRLAYGSTLQKAQGLTLDKCQVDMRTWQFRKPAMAYVAMSRCRSLEGLRLVGQKEVVAAACVSDERVKRWL